MAGINDEHGWLGDYLDVLANRRRRMIVRVLMGTDAISLRELANRIGQVEQETDSLESAERKAVYVTLYQTHVPTLEDIDAVEYDRQSKTVARGAAYPKIRRLLTAIDSVS